MLVPLNLDKPCRIARIEMSYVARSSTVGRNKSVECADKEPCVTRADGEILRWCFVAKKSARRKNWRFFLVVKILRWCNHPTRECVCDNREQLTSAK